MGYDFGDIKDKVRLITGRLSSDQMSDTELDMRINNYLHYEFPAEFKLETNLVPYSFLTVKGQQNYALPENFTNFVPPFYINGLDFSYYGGTYWNSGINNINQYGLNYFFNPSVYYQSVGQYFSRNIWRTGDGVTTGFSQAAQNFGILPESVIITDNVETFTDNGLGILTGSLGGMGTVNYLDGSINVTFASPPAVGAQIWLTFVQYQSGQPQQILNFNGFFKLYPVPDNVYKVQMVGYQMPAILVDANDTPKLQEWGPCIAYGTARTIFADYGELDRYGEITALYKEQVKYVNRRDIQNTMNRSAIRSS
jgi:hypothetical protein